MLICCLFIILFSKYIFVKAVFGSNSSSSYDDDFIYRNTVISPFFDEGASSSLLKHTPKKFDKEGSNHIHLPKDSALPSHTNTGQSTPDKILYRTGRGRYKRNAKMIENIRASWTEERKKEFGQRSREMNTGRLRSKEFSEKMKKVNAGRKKSEETKRKISDSVTKTIAKKREATKTVTNQQQWLNIVAMAMCRSLCILCIWLDTALKSTELHFRGAIQ